jgi:beta-glucuronidase
MIRLFTQHYVRDVRSLDGTWEWWFPRYGTTIGIDAYADGTRSELEVPGCWESSLARVNYRGQAVLRRTFTTCRTGPIRLAFAGVSHTARVSVDGCEVGGHHDAFTGFAIDLPQLGAGEHELLVHVSNEHGRGSSLHVPNDYYDYGGITRPVELHVLARPAFILRVDLTPVMRAGVWQAVGEAILGNCGENPVACDLRVAVGDADYTSTVVIPPGGCRVPIQLSPGAVMPWTPRTPHLAWIEARLADADGVFDDWRDRMGFRTIACEGERLVLNDDQPLVLLGFNRHEDHGEFGNALPVSAMRRDLELLRDLNANCIRGSHYPQDERFLDLCDEQGFLVWDESHGRALDLSDATRHPRLREQSCAVTRELVEQHRNHPSVILWGVLNECSSHIPEGRAIYAEQFALIHSLDTSRPTTFASWRRQDDICQDLPDVCGWNLYPDWYGNADARQDLDGLLMRFSQRGQEGKPVIVSESGAGGIPGLHDPIRRAKWSEERQADILAGLCEVYARHPRLSGFLIWQFSDVRVDESFAPSRPGCINDKGVVGQWRKPKLSYAVVRAAFGRLRDELGWW